MKKEKIKISIEGGGNTFIYLPNALTKKRRLLGKVNFAAKTFYTSPKSKSKHMLRSLNAIGLCYDLIFKNPKIIRYINMNLDYSQYWTSRKAILHLGVIKHYKNKGFEKQIFLPLELWKHSQHEAKKERNYILKQLKNKI